MYQDKPLVPAEAVKLAALGALMGQAMSYAALARDIRYFTARVVGPSLDLLGSSLEILKLEGLIESVQVAEDPEKNILAVTSDGRMMFEDLMSCALRTPPDDASRLVLALKLRFLNYLDKEARLDQIDLIREITQTELARYEDLKKKYAEGFLGPSLEIEIRQSHEKLDWLNRLEIELESHA